jgi:hypothetical protein
LSISDWTLALRGTSLKTTFQEEVIGPEGISLQPSEHICQDVLLPKGFSMKNKSQFWICSVY